MGLEQGLFPNFRSLDDPAAVEEERRLCYVGITRAQEQLYLSHARERRLYGNREPAIASQFLAELPKELLASTLVKVKRLKGESSKDNLQQANLRLSTQTSQQATQSLRTPSEDWKVGELLIHDAFGTGEVTHIFGSGNKISLAVRFPGLGQNPRSQTHKFTAGELAAF